MDIPAFYERYLDHCNAHRFEDLDEFVARDVVVNGEPVGMGAYIRGLHVIVEAFEDYHWHLDHLLVQDQWMAAHLWDTGTHTGIFHGIRPTGRRIRTQEFAHYRVVDDLIAEVWVTADDLDTVNQLSS